MERYYQIFRDVLDIMDREEIEGASITETEEWDSFVHMQLIARIEEAYHIRLDGEDALRFRSFETGLCLLREKGCLREADQ